MRRYFYNDDGDTCLSQYRGPFTPRMVADAADALAGTAVTTLVYCVAPSDLVNYPSQVADMPGWRRTPSHESGHYRRQYEFYQHVRREGWDIPRMVMERCAGLGLEFMPSVRMNDAHFGQKVHPTEHPWTSRFWLEHQDLAMGPADFPFWGNEHLHDFRHPEVRAYRQALLDEVIDRYGDQGVELDWTRHYTFFRPGEARPDLLTDMVVRARQRLDARGGARRPLIVRVAPTVQSSRACGLDVATWVRRGLVDYVVPSSPSRYISVDLPVHEWLELVAGTGVEVHPSPDSASPFGDGQATVGMYRAAASNAYALGAHGFYVFNLFCQGFPLDGDQYRILRDVAHPAALDRRDKLFLASPDAALWRPDTDILPMKLEAVGSTAQVAIQVGDDVGRHQADGTLRQARLRLCLDYLEPDEEVSVRLNGQPLESGSPRPRRATQREVVAHTRQVSAWTYEGRELGSNPGIWLEFDADPSLYNSGDNRISLRRERGVGPPIQVVRAELRVRYGYCD